MWKARLDLGVETSYYDDTETCDRNLNDEIFDKLFGHWFREDWIAYEYKTPGRKARSAVVYSPLCPLYVMVCSASVYRMHSDMPMFTSHWRSLDRLQKQLGYRMNPWVQYFMVTNICNHSNSTKDWLNEVITLNSATNHMPIDGDRVDIAAIQYVAGWTADLFAEGNGLDRSPLPTQFDMMYNEDHAFTYMGRDAYFIGEEIRRDNWIVTESRSAGIVKQESNPYSTTSFVHLPEFFHQIKFLVAVLFHIEFVSVVAVGPAVTGTKNNGFFSVDRSGSGG